MKRGFTLIELLVVVGMIAILTGAASSSVMKARTRAKISRATTECREITNAILAYENWAPDRTLSDVAKKFNRDEGVDAAVSDLDFILGREKHANGPGGMVPVLYNGAAMSRGGGGKKYLLDPWGTPYRIIVKPAGDAQAKADTLGNDLTTFMFVPNRNRPVASER